MKPDRKMLAYCGLYCEQCSLRAACAEKDWKHLEQFPEKYRKNLRDFSDCDCEGCKGRNLCGPCAIKDCAAARGLECCADCGEFPCPLLQRFGDDGVPHHRQALENLRRIRAEGVEAWFDRFQPQLRCRCGERQSWYYRCPKHPG